MERLEGYYWVKMEYQYFGAWQAAYYDGIDTWRVLSNTNDMFDEVFDEIGERIIPPNN